MPEKKRIIVACGGAVATSTVAAEKVRDLLKAHGIPAEVTQCRIAEIAGQADHADLIVTTARVDRDYGVPTVHGIAFISGIRIEETEQRIIELLTA